MGIFKEFKLHSLGWVENMDQGVKSKLQHLQHTECVNRNTGNVP